MPVCKLIFSKGTFYLTIIKQQRGQIAVAMAAKPINTLGGVADKFNCKLVG